MFGLRRKVEQERSAAPEERLKRLVRETRDRPASLKATEVEALADEPDVMDLLVDLRAAARRGSAPAAAHKLGAEFARYLAEFYALSAELQPLVIEALLVSQRQEQAGSFNSAVQTCQSALEVCASFPALLERLAVLELRRGQRPRAERWYSRLLAELDRQELTTRALEVAQELAEQELTDQELLGQCARQLEAGGRIGLAVACSRARATLLLAAGQAIDALTELDRALNLRADDASLHLELALIYEQLGEVDRAAAVFSQAELLARDDLQTLTRLLLIRARSNRPDEAALGRLMDLVELHPEAAPGVLAACEAAVQDGPYNPHLRYVQGVLQAQGGQLEAGIASLHVAVERYAVQSDQASELEARLALQQLAPLDEPNRRRIAELHFERGEVRLAMQALADLARVIRGSA